MDGDDNFTLVIDDLRQPERCSQIAHISSPRQQVDPDPQLASASTAHLLSSAEASSPIPAQGSAWAAPQEMAVSSSSLANQTNSSDVIDYIRFALADLEEQDILLLSFLPLPVELLGEFPNRMLAPQPGADTLDVREVHRAVEVLEQEKVVVVGVCSFATDQEQTAVRRIVKQLRGLKSVEFTFVVLLRPTLSHGGEVSTVMARNVALLEMGVSDVIVHPQKRAGWLRSAVHSRKKQASREQSSVKDILHDMPLTMTPEKFHELEYRQHRLLWEQAPAELMLEFRPVDRNIREDNLGVGQYRFVRQLRSVEGRVHEALDENDVSVVVKVVSKAAVHSGGEMESIYRETQFLGRILNHPNIARCIDTVHATYNFYIVLEYAGSETLATTCAVQPEERLTETTAIAVFTQIVHGLGFMHERSIAHRRVSLEHVALKMQHDAYHCTLLDFRSAIHARVESLSSTLCGELPCMPPDMVVLQSYSPRCADAWSAGVVLLEIAGGLQSLSLSARANEAEGDVVDAMNAIVEFFASPNSHAAALGSKSGVQSNQVVDWLRQLLLMPPRNRVNLTSLSESLNQD